MNKRRLSAAILAIAVSLGARNELYQQWGMDGPRSLKQVGDRAKRITVKVWRFEGKMREIASTFREAGLPDRFHEAAAEIYHRMAEFKDSNQMPTLGSVLSALLSKNDIAI